MLNALQQIQISEKTVCNLCCFHEMYKLYDSRSLTDLICQIHFRRKVQAKDFTLLIWELQASVSKVEMYFFFSAVISIEAQDLHEFLLCAVWPVPVECVSMPVRSSHPSLPYV